MSALLIDDVNARSRAVLPRSVAQKFCPRRLREFAPGAAGAALISALILLAATLLQAAAAEDSEG